MPQNAGLFELAFAVRYAVVEQRRAIIADRDELRTRVL